MRTSHCNQFDLSSASETETQTAAVETEKQPYASPELIIHGRIEKDTLLSLGGDL